MYSRGTILFVDDHHSAHSAFLRTFGHLGYHILTADNGTEGLKLLTEHPVDVLVADYVMPDITGIALMVRAKERFPDLQCILVSGFGDTETKLRRAGVANQFPCVHKPWDRKHLERLIDNLIGEAQRLKSPRARPQYWMPNRPRARRTAGAQH